MAVLSVMSIQGDPDELVARMQETIEPVAARKAARYGGISSTVVRTDDGITIYNLWETEDGRHRMAQDPEIKEAVREAGFPKPDFKGYEVLSPQTAGEHAKELSRRVAEEVWTSGNLDVIDELFASYYHGWTPTDGEIHGPEGFRELVERYRSAFSDMTMTPDNLVAEGDWVTMSWTAHGTHTGELMGVAPTGREVTVSGIQVSRIAHGKFAEGHGSFDSLGLLQQLGVVPAGAPAHA
jgi:predicted ester cyclase